MRGSICQRPCRADSAEILSAIETGIGNAGDAQLDALIIIRGGGAVNDLAWLNDYQLARFICMCPVPVLTGIGHERDSTVLDEVAHRSFDTPSKLVAAIEKQIATRAREAKDAYDGILVQVRRFNQRASIDAERLDSEIRLRGARHSRPREPKTRRPSTKFASLHRLKSTRLDMSASCPFVKCGTTPGSIWPRPSSKPRPQWRV